MTQWVDGSRAGRARGPRALVLAWIAVLIRPRRFFRRAVAPGDQAPGLTFAMAVVLVEEASRLLATPSTVPAIAGGRLPSAAIAVGVAVLLATPAVLHLVAGLETLVLLVLVDDRAGISETVQVLGYATAPCVLAGLPSPEIRLACAAYGAGLLAIGTAEVHGVGRRRALVVTALPAAIVFGYGFRGFPALADLLARWYII